MAPTHDIQLLKFKSQLLKMRQNRNFSPSFTLATFQVLRSMGDQQLWYQIAHFYHRSVLEEYSRTTVVP